MHHPSSIHGLVDNGPSGAHQSKEEHLRSQLWEVEGGPRRVVDMAGLGSLRVQVCTLTCPEFQGVTGEQTFLGERRPRREKCAKQLVDTHVPHVWCWNLCPAHALHVCCCNLCPYLSQRKRHHSSGGLAAGEAGLQACGRVGARGRPPRIISHGLLGHVPLCSDVGGHMCSTPQWPVPPLL